MTVIDDFKISTKKYCFFYEFEKLWLVLTSIDLLAVYFMIRGCTAPLLFDSKFWTFWFYTSPNADKTIYNVAISYFAAYIFYIIQVYLPARQKTINALLELRTHMHNLVLEVSRFLKVYECYTAVDNVNQYEERVIFAKRRTIYLKDTDDFVYKVDSKTFEGMLERISKSYEQIILNEAFINADYSLKKLLLEENIPKSIKSRFDIVMKAEHFNASGKIGIAYINDDRFTTYKRMQFIKKIFSLNVNTDISITTDKNDIEKVEKREQEFRKAISEAYNENSSQLSINILTHE